MQIVCQEIFDRDLYFLFVKIKIVTNFKGGLKIEKSEILLIT